MEAQTSFEVFAKKSMVLTIGLRDTAAPYDDQNQEAQSMHTGHRTVSPKLACEGTRLASG
jgi:hypothetical protein